VNLYPQPVYLPADPVPFFSTDGVGVQRGSQIGIWNREPVGVLLDRIVISPGENAQSESPAPGVQIQMRYRSETITNGFVTAGAVGWPVNRAIERGQYVNGFQIKLAKPMWLAPGELIEVMLSNANFRAPFNVTFYVAGVGVQSLTPPKERWLPYLTSFESQVITGGVVTAISEASDPTELGNPFAVPLHIEHLIGRVLTTNTTNPAVQNFTDRDLHPSWFSTTVRLTDNQDNAWIAVPTPMAIAFDATFRSWRVRHMMPPRGYLKLELGGFSYSGVPINRNSIAVVGMDSYRRVA
jgi:hypothetical protein